MKTPVHRLAALACAGLAAPLLLGCGSTPGGGTADDVIVMGTLEKVAYLDPAAGYDPGSWMVFNNVFQSLLSFPSGGVVPRPEAAKECRFGDGASTVYRCTLRPGLRFTDGHPLTAKDVKYSFDRTLRINHPDGPAALLSTIRNVSAPDGRTVVFRLKVPDATFPMKIASGAGAIVDHREYPRDGLRRSGTVAGSGVYRLDSFNVGRSAVFSPNTGYKGPAERKNKGLVLRFFNGDQAALGRAVDRKTVDLAYRGPAARDIARLAGANTEDVRVVEGTSAETRYLVFDTAGKTTGNKAVRQAVAQLIDRKALIRNAYERTKEPLYSIIPKGVTAHDSAFYDRWGEASAARAGKLLRDAGITRRVPLTLWYTPVRYGPETRAEFAELRRQLNASGLFDARTRSAPWPEYKEGLAKGRYGVYAIGWVPDFPDPENFTAPFFGPGNVLYNHYANRRITEELIPATSRQPERDLTLKAFYGIQDTIAEDVPMLPLWQGRQYAVVQDDIAGLEWTLDVSPVFRFWEISKTAR